MVKAIEVAEYFACMAEPEAGDSITNLKLQKLLYYAQGAHLALTGTALFYEEIEAWQHGPVVPAVYDLLSKYGSSPVEFPAPRKSIDTITTESKSILDEVYRVYGQFSAWKLRDMTHQEDPWKSNQRREPISHGSLKNYFSENVVTGG